ncbi:MULTISPECIES: hypothetical protein [Microbacterium]|nr:MULTISPECIES: hypothetical protein [Microbacterium]
MTRPAIYDARNRTEYDPQRNGESTFEFFNRVAGAYWEQSRALHQAWADNVGDPNYADVRAALRSDNAQARSAFLELFLHQSLLGAGCQVLIHPEVPRSSHRPDFMARRDSSAFYVEAIVPGTPKAQQARASREADLLAALDQVGDPNFLLVTVDIKQGLHSAPGANFRQQIRDWLATLDPDQVDVADLPSLTLARGDWSVTIDAMPRRASSRGQKTRSIGIYAHGEAQFIDDGQKLRAALNSKASRYGNLDAPFVIAVGMYTFDEDDEDVHDALYGSTAWVVDESGPDGRSETRGIRNHDGYFGSPAAWRNRRVSGVLVVDQLSFHDPTRARVTLWLHPDPLHPLPPESLFPGTIREWDGETVAKRVGQDLRTLLGLPESWPEGDPWK